MADLAIPDRPYRLNDLTWQELVTVLNRTSTVLLPVGSVEQHGHHLPLGVDVQMPVGICERVAARTDCLLAPAIPYGVSPHHTFKPGTVTVGAETFQHYVRDVCASMAEWGVEQVLLVNGHYLAQDPDLDVVVRELANEHDLDAYHVPLHTMWEDAAEEGRESDVSFHASEFETSAMLELEPDLVHLDRAVDVEPPAESLPHTDYDAYGENRIGWSLSAEEMEKLTESGNVGAPSAATAELGGRLVETAVENVVELVEALEA